MEVNDVGCMEFGGGYGGNLEEEMNKLWIIGGVVGGEEELEIIDGEDWVRYGGGVDGKMVSGKGVCMDVDGRDFEGWGGKVKGRVYWMEKKGMDYGEWIMCVWEVRGGSVMKEYDEDGRKVFGMDNGV